MPRFPSISKIPGHQQFEYTPRHYDPLKEDLEERVRSAKGEATVRDAKSRISGHFTRLRSGKGGGKASRSSRTRILIIIISLTLICWYILGAPAPSILF